MYFVESYNICLKYFFKFLVFSKINAKNHDFHGFYHENRLFGNFHYYIRNQCAKKRKYTQFQRNQRISELYSEILLIFNHQRPLVDSQDFEA